MLFACNIFARVPVLPINLNNKNQSAMKKKTCTLLLILTIILSNTIQKSVYSQTTTDTNLTNQTEHNSVQDTIKPSKKDTTVINFKKKKIRIIGDQEGTSIEVKKDEEDSDFDVDKDDDFDFNGDEEDFDIHWAGFEFGINNYVNNNFSMNLSDKNSFMELNTSKSWNINLNIIEYEFPLIKENFGIGSGLGFEFNDYRFDNLQPIKKEGDQIVTDTSYKNFNVDKAKLTTTYITLPILFEYQSDAGEDDNKFFVTAGIIGGIKIGSHTKVVYNNDKGNKKKDKERGDFYLSPLRYGYSLKMGYGFLKVFANYYQTGLFQKDKGPEIHPFTVGFTISF